MGLLNPRVESVLLKSAVLLAIVANSGIVPRKLVAAQTAAANKVEAKVQSGGGRGKFISFKKGTLTIEANDGTLIQNKLPDSTRTFHWHDDGGFKPVETIATLEQVKAGAWIYIQLEKATATVRIGSRKGVTIGTFVSYKNNRLLLLSRNLGESFVKKYGNQVHFNKFRDDVQVYESVDGGDYQLLGFANKELSNVKEGTVITVHGEGDDNITLVQIGVPTKKTDKALDTSRVKPSDSAALNTSGYGSFVSFQNGTLTIKGKSGPLVYDHVGENYKTYQNNEDGPGSKLVNTVEALSGSKLPGNVPALSRVLPGTAVRVNVEEREIYFGLDHRIVGRLRSYEAGKLNLVAFDAPPGYVNKAADSFSLLIDPNIPVLESIDGGDLKFAGLVKEVLKNAREGAIVTIRKIEDVIIDIKIGVAE